MISCNQTSCTSASSSYSLSLALPCRAKPSWSSCCTSQRPGSRPPAPVRIVLTPRRASEDDDAERTDRLDSSDRRPLAAINSHQQTAPCLQMLVATFGVWMVPQPAIPTTLCHWMLVLCSVPSCPILSHPVPPCPIFFLLGLTPTPSSTLQLGTFSPKTGTSTPCGRTVSGARPRKRNELLR